MAKERVQKSFGQSKSNKKHNPIVPPLVDHPTQADSQLSPKVKPSRIPSKEERDAIKRKIFDSISRTGENQAMREGLFSPTVRVQNTPDSASTIGMPIQPKLTIGEPGDKYEQEADRVAAQVVNLLNAPVAQQKSQNQEREEVSVEDELQMKSEVDTIQHYEIIEEEEELQMKPTTVQLQAGASGMTVTPEVETSIQQARVGGQALADNIRQPMEQAFGADFSGVKVHTDAQADQLNQSIQAKAFTTGQDMFFRQGAYEPGSRGGQELIAHELTHVVQQNSGLDSKNKKQISMKPFIPMKVSQDKNAREQLLQRSLFVENTEYKDAQMAFDTMYLKTQNVPYTRTSRLVKNELLLNKDKIVEIINKWINYSSYQGIRMIKQETPLNKSYTDFDAMAWALLGEVISQENLKKETALAEKTYESEYINDKLNELMPKLITQFSNRTGKTIADHFGNSHMGKYWPWYYVTMFGGFSDVFEKPTKYELPAKIAAIHDLTDHYYQVDQDIVNVPIPLNQASGMGRKVSLLDPRNQQPNFRDKSTGTLDERHEAISAARYYLKPLEMGPSYTTGRFMQMASKAGATSEEIKALAWALFAFWNKSYFTSKSGVHRFHEVMDMASNYGLPYNIEDDIPTEPPTDPLISFIIN